MRPDLSTDRLLKERDRGREARQNSRGPPVERFGVRLADKTAAGVDFGQDADLIVMLLRAGPGDDIEAVEQALVHLSTMRCC